MPNPADLGAVDGVRPHVNEVTAAEPHVVGCQRPFRKPLVDVVTPPDLFGAGVLVGGRAIGGAGGLGEHPKIVDEVDRQARPRARTGGHSQCVDRLHYGSRRVLPFGTVVVVGAFDVAEAAPASTNESAAASVSPLRWRHGRTCPMVTTMGATARDLRRLRARP